MVNARNAFNSYRFFSGKEKKDIIFKIAKILENNKENLVALAMKETFLPKKRLEGELSRTVFQLRSYAEAAESGHHLGLRIDFSDNKVQDTRKMMIPIGPIVVFGSANFPFAYSTAGGDTACALAAGCSVVVKAHPGHPLTGLAVANCIQEALPAKIKNIFQYISNADNAVSEELVKHPATAAVAFTGSLVAGRLFYNWAASRNVPIPVFAEMSSINPVFLLPNKLSADMNFLCNKLTDSLTQSAGQFCTNPGLIIGIDSPSLHEFEIEMTKRLDKMNGQAMLNAGILKNYQTSSQKALNTNGVKQLTTKHPESNSDGYPILATVDAKDFMKSPILMREVFGMYSLIIKAKNNEELIQLSSSLEGQLTCSIWATEADIKNNKDLINILREKCGRFIFNGVPTGVRVALSMQHGGPYPATTDSRFTAVGADGISRFCRPLCFQNWPDEFLPSELQNNNPLNLYRIINNVGAVH